MEITYIYLLAVIIFLAVLYFLQVIARKYNTVSLKHNFKRKSDSSKSGLTRSARLSEISNSNLTRLLAKFYAMTIPEDGWQNSKVRLKFIQAGVREEIYFKFFYFIKIVLFIVLLVSISLITLIAYSFNSFTDHLFMIFLISMLGYFAPDIYLFFKTKIRQEKMEAAIPNFLDLLLICAESGLSLDAALLKVTTDLAPANPELCEEFYLALLEIRAGGDRTLAFENLSIRVTSDYMTSILSMFRQVDKFGTSLGDSLRIHSEIIRSQRLQKAENLAAKLPLKLLFPLVTCLFPIVIIVLVGPAVITISDAILNN
jgi:tight adherence protein C